MSHWNQRILAHQHKEEIYFQVHEVFYDKDKNPDSYAESPTTIRGDNTIDITENLSKILKSLCEPILWYGDRFPEVYEAL